MRRRRKGLCGGDRGDPHQGRIRDFQRGRRPIIAALGNANTLDAYLDFLAAYPNSPYFQAGSRHRWRLAGEAMVLAADASRRYAAGLLVLFCGAIRAGPAMAAMRSAVSPSCPPIFEPPRAPLRWWDYDVPAAAA